MRRPGPRSSKCSKTIRKLLRSSLFFTKSSMLSTVQIASAWYLFGKKNQVALICSALGATNGSAGIVVLPPRARNITRKSQNIGTIKERSYLLKSVKSRSISMHKQDSLLDTLTSNFVASVLMKSVNLSTRRRAGTT